MADEVVDPGFNVEEVTRTNEAEQQKADPDQANRRKQDEADEAKPDPPAQIDSPEQDKPAR